MDEVDEVTGERCFDEVRAVVAAGCGEVLTAEGAPAYQREAPRTQQEALARPDAPRWQHAEREELGWTCCPDAWLGYPLTIVQAVLRCEEHDDSRVLCCI